MLLKNQSRRDVIGLLVQDLTRFEIFDSCLSALAAVPSGEDAALSGEISDFCKKSINWSVDNTHVFTASPAKSSSPRFDSPKFQAQNTKTIIC